MFFIHFSTVFRSVLSVPVSGMSLYLSVLYPAACSIWSRSASFSSLPLWLLSSSSITARTSNALFVITKSAIFLSKRFRSTLFFVVSMPPRATCVSTTYSLCGNASHSRQNIGASLSLRSGFFDIFPGALFRFFGGVLSAAATAISASSASARIAYFTVLSSLSVSGV